MKFFLLEAMSLVGAIWFATSAFNASSTVFTILLSILSLFFLLLFFLMKKEVKDKKEQEAAIYEAIRHFTDQGQEVINTNDLYYWMLDHSRWYTGDRAFNNDDIIETFNLYYKNNKLPLQTKLVINQLDFGGRDRLSKEWLIGIFADMKHEGIEENFGEALNRLNAKFKSKGRGGYGYVPEFVQEVYDDCRKKGLI